MNKMSRLFIASDHAGYKLKEELKKFLSAEGFGVEDLGCDSEESCDYADFAFKLAKKVVENNAKGILICGTGIGMSIAANKIKASKQHCVIIL